MNSSFQFIRSKSHTFFFFSFVSSRFIRILFLLQVINAGHPDFMNAIPFMSVNSADCAGLALGAFQQIGNCDDKRTIEKTAK